MAPPKIIFEDESILVLDKPAGLVVTTEGVIKGETMENWLREYFEKAKKIERSGIVHRLDKGTSGLMVVAKDETSLINLKKQFKTRSTKKEYLALVSGDVVMKGQVDAPVGRYRGNFSRFRVMPEGKSALTLFEIIGKYRFENKIFSLVKVIIKTGRTHQIRVHFSYLQWPLVGDVLYGGKEVAGIDRPFLHAAYLGLTHPKTGDWMEWRIGLPSDLLNVLRKMDEII